MVHDPREARSGRAVHLSCLRPIHGYSPWTPHCVTRALRRTYRTRAVITKLDGP